MPYVRLLQLLHALRSRLFHHFGVRSFALVVLGDRARNGKIVMTTLDREDRARNDKQVLMIWQPYDVCCRLPRNVEKHASK